MLHEQLARERKEVKEQINDLKKKLSDRMYQLQDGSLVQRDWYASFLLYCYDVIAKEIEKEKCRKEFDKCYDKEKELIEWIKKNRIKVWNSGIKID